jgi:hypothetical protein
MRLDSFREGHQDDQQRSIQRPVEVIEGKCDHFVGQGQRLGGACQRNAQSLLRESK